MLRILPVSSHYFLQKCILSYCNSRSVLFPFSVVLVPQLLQCPQSNLSLNHWLSPKHVPNDPALLKSEAIKLNTKGEVHHLYNGV